MIRGYGLTTPQFALMEALYHHGSLPLSENGQKLLVTSGNVTYVMDNLCELGLVMRDRSPDDRRVVYARLTSQGEALFEKTFSRPAQEVPLLKKLGPGERIAAEQAV